MGDRDDCEFCGQDVTLFGHAEDCPARKPTPPWSKEIVELALDMNPDICSNPAPVDDK